MFVFHLSLHKPKDNVLVPFGGRTKSLEVHLQRIRTLYLFLFFILAVFRYVVYIRLLCYFCQ